jgi:hemerythrin-like domain-containing protein
MKKIVLLLFTITSLFGQWKYQTNPTTLRQLYVLDQNHLKHYSNQLEWRTEHQIILIHNMQQAMNKVKKGKYTPNKSQEIADVIQKYVDVEKQHREDLRVLQIKLKELTK